MNEQRAPARFKPLAPMKRHKGLFMVLLLAWVAWCGVMIALYFTTVRPHAQLYSPPAATSPAHPAQTALG